MTGIGRMTISRVVMTGIDHIPVDPMIAMIEKGTHIVKKGGLFGFVLYSGVSKHLDRDYKACHLLSGPPWFRDLVTYNEHAKQKTMTALDIVYALKQSG